MSESRKSDALARRDYLNVVNCGGYSEEKFRKGFASMADSDSVTQWLVDLQEGDESAAQQLWDRYFRRLAALAGKRLQDIPRLPTDGEDVALSAMHSLCKGVNAGRFPDLSDRDSLWKLLVVITSRKANHAIRDEFRQKRGGGQVVGESVLLNRSERESGARGVELVLGQEPTPEFAAQVDEEMDRLFDLLPDDELKQIAALKMQGVTSEEIAQQIGKALSTVERRMKLIRTLWAEYDPM
jgi:DNA-directed RNA polymerase specialized sigma24 family protein